MMTLPIARLQRWRLVFIYLCVCVYVMITQQHTGNSYHLFIFMFQAGVAPYLWTTHVRQFDSRDWSALAEYFQGTRVLSQLCIFMCVLGTQKKSTILLPIGHLPLFESPIESISQFLPLEKYN